MAAEIVKRKRAEAWSSCVLGQNTGYFNKANNNIFFIQFKKNALKINKLVMLSYLL